MFARSVYKARGRKYRFDVGTVAPTFTLLSITRSSNIVLFHFRQLSIHVYYIDSVRAVYRKRDTHTHTHTHTRTHTYALELEGMTNRGVRNPSLRNDISQKRSYRSVIFRLTKISRVNSRIQLFPNEKLSTIRTDVVS